MTSKERLTEWREMTLEQQNARWMAMLIAERQAELWETVRWGNEGKIYPFPGTAGYEEKLAEQKRAAVRHTPYAYPENGS